MNVHDAFMSIERYTAAQATVNNELVHMFLPDGGGVLVLIGVKDLTDPANRGKCRVSVVAKDGLSAEAFLHQFAPGYDRATWTTTPQA